MKATYTTRRGKLKFDLNGGNQKEIFKELAEIQEIFEEQKCGCCKSEDIKYIVRTVDDNNFYEMKCNACGAKLAYGAHKKGDSLFPKRKEEDGSYSNTAGWSKYTPQACG